MHLEFCRFPEIKKVLGCRLGDQLLKVLAGRLADAAGDNKTLARVGEAEFALLLLDAGQEESIEEAQRLVAILHHPVQVAEFRLNAQVGIGIALFPDHAANADEILRRANAAMQRATPTSDSYAVYACGQERGHTRRLTLMGDLHLAIAQDQLSL